MLNHFHLTLHTDTSPDTRWVLISLPEEMIPETKLMADVHFPGFESNTLGNCLMMDKVHVSGEVRIDLHDTFSITSKADASDTSTPIWHQMTPSGMFWTKISISIDSYNGKKLYLVLTVNDTPGPDILIFAMDNIELHTGSCNKLQGDISQLYHHCTMSG